MKVLVQVWCWLLMAGVAAVGAIWLWMYYEMAGFTLKQVMDAYRDLAVVGVAWSLYERYRRVSVERSAS